MFQGLNSFEFKMSAVDIKDLQTLPVSYKSFGLRFTKEIESLPQTQTL